MSLLGLLLGILTLCVIYPFVIIFWVVQKYTIYFLMTAVILTVVVSVIAIRWKTPTRKEMWDKVYTLSLLVVSVFVVVFLIGLWSMNRTNHAIDVECNSRLEQVKDVMGQLSHESKFQTSMDIGAAAKYPACQTKVDTWLLEYFYNIDSNTELSVAELEAAWQLYQRVTKPRYRCESDYLDNAYTRIQVRRLGPAGAVKMIREYGSLDEWNACRQSYLYQLRQRCEGVWKDRCAIELPREALEDVARNHKAENELADLIKAVWGVTVEK
jgi:hypothetical protein